MNTTSLYDAWLRSEFDSVVFARCRNIMHPITSINRRKQVMFSPMSLCLFVCLATLCLMELLLRISLQKRCKKNF